MSDKNVVSFRVECQVDLDNIMAVLEEDGYEPEIVCHLPDEVIPDVVAEIETTASFEEFMSSISRIPDVHVAYQTAKPVSWPDNPMERDHSIFPGDES